MVVWFGTGIRYSQFTTKISTYFFSATEDFVFQILFFIFLLSHEVEHSHVQDMQYK